MEDRNLEQVKELIDEIADSYDLPTEEQTEKMRILAGQEWEAEDLQMLCCEYWSHNSLDETAYLMFHEEYPPVHDVDLVFWKYKQGAVMDDQQIYEKYRFGRGTLKALEALPYEEILQKIENSFQGIRQYIDTNRNRDDNGKYRFDFLEQAHYWTDAHFWIFPYGRETDTGKEIQLVRFLCHNMSEQQLGTIVTCMEELQCPLHIKEEKIRIRGKI